MSKYVAELIYLAKQFEHLMLKDQTNPGPHIIDTLTRTASSITNPHATTTALSQLILAYLSLLGQA